MEYLISTLAANNALRLTHIELGKIDEVGLWRKEEYDDEEFRNKGYDKNVDQRQ